MLKLLKKYWDILGGTIMGLIISFITQWQTEKMQMAYTTIILILVCIGLFKVVKSSYENRNLLDKLVQKQSSVRAVKIAQNPTQEGEELGELFIETMKGSKKAMEKIKNFLKRLWGNKLTIINIFVTLLVVLVVDYLVFSEYLLKYDFVVQNQLMFKIGVPLLSGLYAVLDIFTTVSKYGWESLGELQNKAEQKLLQKASKLTSEQKAIIKNNIKKVKSDIEIAQNELLKTADVIKNFEILQSLNGLVTISAENVTLYNNAVSRKPILEANLSQFKLELTQLEEALK